jgi:hypothetical protein
MVQRAQEIRPSSAGEANAEPSSAMGAERERGEARVRHAAADWTETDNDDEDSDNEQNGEDNEHGDGSSEDGNETTPLLPVFSTAYLGIHPHEYSSIIQYANLIQTAYRSTALHTLSDPWFSHDPRLP